MNIPILPMRKLNLKKVKSFIIEQFSRKSANKKKQQPVFKQRKRRRCKRDLRNMLVQNTSPAHSCGWLKMKGLGRTPILLRIHLLSIKCTRATIFTPNEIFRPKCYLLWLNISYIRKLCFPLWATESHGKDFVGELTWSDLCLKLMLGAHEILD